MNIGIEATSVCVSNPTGIQKYIVQQLRAMDALLAEQNDVRGGTLYRASRWRRREFAPDLPHLPRRWYMGGRAPLLGKYDLLHAMDRRMPRNAGRKVFTVYDMAIFLDEHQFDGYSTPTFREKLLRQYRGLAKQSRAIVSISHSTKSDILKFLDFPADRIEAIYPGLDGRFVHFDAVSDLDESRLKALGLRPKSYLLFVGQVTVRKNASRIARAFLESRASQDSVLVFAGKADPLPAELDAILQDTRARNSIRLLGYTNDRDLPHLYAGALAFVYSSLYEGFGLPILEAMACLTPVVTANRGAAPEVSGGHAVLADPFSVDAIREGIDEAIELSVAKRLAAREHARSFSWERSARAHLDLYRNVCAE